MKKNIIIIALILSLFASPAQAFWLTKMLRILLQIQGIQTDMLTNQQEGLGVEKNMLSAQKSIDEQMKALNSNVTGHYGWGNYQAHDYQSYGDNANDWNQLLQMAANGQGGGDLGRMIQELSREFPAETQRFNQSVKDKNAQTYYALKTRTILAARAASQLDYNKIQDQLTYQRMLQQQIEKTKDIKAAMDLSNRIHVEGNLINLEILRQVVLANQQQAVNEQSSINTVLANAKFLTR